MLLLEGCYPSAGYKLAPKYSVFSIINFASVDDETGKCGKPIDIEGSVISISFSTAVDVLTDLMIMALPIKLLTFLHVSRAQRFALIGIFSVGCIVIACALIRLTQIVAQARSDPVGLAVWGIVEGSMSVVVGSLPALKGFFGRAWDRTIKRRSGQVNSSDVQWNGHARLGRITITDNAEKSWASANAAPLQPSDLHTPNVRWSCTEQSPMTSMYCGGVDDDERMLRSNSDPTTEPAREGQSHIQRSPSG